MPSKVFGGGRGKGRRSRRRGETERGKGEKRRWDRGFLRSGGEKRQYTLGGYPPSLPPVPLQPPARVAGACATPDGMGMGLGGMGLFRLSPDALPGSPMGYGIWDMMRADALPLPLFFSAWPPDPDPARVGPAFLSPIPVPIPPEAPTAAGPRAEPEGSPIAGGGAQRSRPSPKGPHPPRGGVPKGLSGGARGSSSRNPSPRRAGKRNERERSKEKERNIYKYILLKKEPPRSARPRQLPLALRALAPHGRAPPRG